MKLLREPLLHFLVLGAALFGGFSLLHGRDKAAPEEIVITRGEIRHLNETWQRMRQRPPTRQELDGLIDERIREEVLYREALALGLDRNDTIVRRRLRQKMEFLAEDPAALEAPTDADLQAFLDAHPAMFRIAASTSFEQVFMNPELHGDALRSNAAALLERLRSGAASDLGAVSDPLLLPEAYESASEADIARAFGGDFAAALQFVPVGDWQGPVESVFGWHLVRVRSRSDSRAATLDDVRDALVQAWRREHRTQLIEAAYERLRARYRVIVESPDPQPPAGSAAATE